VSNPSLQYAASCFGSSWAIITEYQLIKKRTYEDAMLPIS